MKNKVPVTNTEATKVLRRVLIQNVLKKIGTGKNKMNKHGQQNTCRLRKKLKTKQKT